MSRESDLAEKKMLLRPRRRRRRLVVLGVLVLLFAGVVALLPTIAGGVAPGIIAGAVGDGVAGRVEVDRVSLSWTGPQRVEGLRLYAPDSADPAADVTAEVSRGLIGLVLNRRDPGEVVVTGRVDVKRAPDGTINLAEALRSTKASASSESPLDGLALRVRDLDVTFDDQAAGVSVAVVFGASLDYISGSESRATLVLRPKSDVGVGADESLKVELTLNGLDNIAAPDPAGLSGSVVIVNEVQSASLDDIDRRWGVLRPFELSLGVGGGYVRLAEAFEIPLDTGRLLDETLAKATDGSGVAFEMRPTVAMRINTFAAPIPGSGADWSQSMLEAFVDVGSGVAVIEREGSGPMRVETEAFEMSIRSSDLSALIEASVRTGVTLDGERAGELTGTFNLRQRDAGLFPAPESLDADATLASFRPAVIAALDQTIAQATREAFGDLLNVQAKQSVTFRDGVRLSTTDVRVDGDGGSASAEVDFSGEGVRVVAAEGDLGTPDAVLRDLLATAMPGATWDGGDRLTFAATDLRIEPSAVTRPWGAWDVSGEAMVGGRAWRFTPPGSDRTVALRDVSLRLPRLDPTDLQIEADITGSVGETPLALNGELIALDLLDASGVLRPDRLKLGGTMTLTGAPTSLAASLLGDRIGPLVAESAGDAVDVTLSGRHQTGLPGLAALEVRGRDLALDALASIADRTVTIGPSRLNLAITPALSERVAATFAPNLTPSPRVTQRVRTTSEIQPFSFDLDESGRPDMMTLRPIRVLTTFEDPAVVRPLPTSLTEKGLRDAVGVRSLETVLRYDRLDAKRNHIKIDGEIFDPAASDAALARLEALVGIYPGLVSAEIILRDGATNAIGAFVGRPDVVAEAFGETVSASLKAWQDPRVEYFSTNVNVQSPRLRGGVMADVHETYIEAPGGLAGAWTITPELIGALNEQTSSAVNAFRLNEAVEAQFAAKSLRVARGGDLFDPSVFVAVLQFGAPSVSFARGGQSFELRNVKAELSSRDEAGTYDFLAVVESPDRATGVESPYAVTTTGVVYGLHDASGATTPERISLALNADGRIPTGLVDSLIAAEGLLVEALGPEATVDVVTDESGAIRGGLTSQRASLSLSGRLADGRFAVEGDSAAELLEITPALSRRLLNPLVPVFERFEVTRDAGRPIRITTSDLTFDLGSGAAGLNGDIRVDFGEGSFVVAPWLRPLLRMTDNRIEGRVGHRLAPLDIAVRSGVASYENFAFPVGDVNLTSGGSVDLVRRRIDLRMLVPVEEASAELRRSLGGVDVDVSVPIDVTGPLSQPNVNVNPGALIERGVNSALEGLIRGGLNDLFGGDKDEKKRDKDKKKKADR
ncbi:MAG: hypothetical protein RIB58_04710 [Phycisphaerales bacterium]